MLESVLSRVQHFDCVSGTTGVEVAAVHKEWEWDLSAYYTFQDNIDCTILLVYSN